MREGFERPETLVWWRQPTFELLTKGLSYPPSKERSKVLMIPATTQRKAFLVDLCLKVQTGPEKYVF